MTEELRPTPIVKGEAARRFYRTIGTGTVSQEQKDFLEGCAALLNSK